MKSYYRLEEINLEQAYKLYEKGFYLELTKDLLDEPIFIVNREEEWFFLSLFLNNSIIAKFSLLSITFAA